MKLSNGARQELKKTQQYLNTVAYYVGQASGASASISVHTAASIASVLAKLEGALAKAGV